MKFTIYHDPAKKVIKIPRPALQISGLSRAEKLVLHIGTGYVVIGRGDTSATETVALVACLRKLLLALLDQLADASCQAEKQGVSATDSESCLDESMCRCLQSAGVDLEGLRVLMLEGDAGNE